MHSLLNRNVYFVKQQLGLFKAERSYDIYDPESKELILICREKGLSFFTKLLRFTDMRLCTPFNVEILTPDGTPLVRVSRDWTFFMSKVKVFDESNQLIGSFKQQLFSFGGAFDVLDPADQFLCKLQGKWTSWDFRFIAGDQEFAHVTKKWAGIGKELFTQADNYILEINDSVPEDNPLRQLIMAAVMCIDMVLKS